MKLLHFDLMLTNNGKETWNCEMKCKRTSNSDECEALFFSFAEDLIKFVERERFVSEGKTKKRVKMDANVE